jgi:hypothetical protein
VEFMCLILECFAFHSIDGTNDRHIFCALLFFSKFHIWVLEAWEQDGLVA